MSGNRHKRGAGLAFAKPTTVPRMLTLLVALLLALVSMGAAPQMASAATGDQHSGDIAWGQQGRDKADPGCQPGQTAAFHFVLAPSGTTLVDAGSIEVTYADGSTDGSAGVIRGQGAGSYDVTGGYDAVASSAMVTGAVWTGDGTPMLVLSSSSCQGEPDAPPATEVTPAAPTQVDKCGTKDDTFTVPSTEGVQYLVNGKVTEAGTYPGTGTVTVEAQPVSSDYTLKGDTSWTLKFSDEPCVQPPVYNPKGSLSSECEVADGAKTGFTVVNAVFDNSGSDVEVTYEVVETIDGKTNYYQIPVGAGKVVTPQVFYSRADGKKVELTVNALDTQVAHLSFETGTCGVSVTPPPPPTKTCPAGMKWVDLNGNGMVDKGECKTPQPPVDHNPPAQQPPAAHQPPGTVPAANPGLNPGFGAHTGWDEHTSSQGGNALGLALGLMLSLGLAVGACVRRRRIGESA